MRTADLECEWQVAPGDKGRPSLVSLVPGGSLTFEHRNIARQARQARAPPPGCAPHGRAGRPRRAPRRSERAGVGGAWPPLHPRQDPLCMLGHAPLLADGSLRPGTWAVEICRARGRARRSATSKDSFYQQDLELGWEVC